MEPHGVRFPAQPHRCAMGLLTLCRNLCRSRLRRAGHNQGRRQSGILTPAITAWPFSQEKRSFEDYSGFAKIHIRLPIYMAAFRFTAISPPEGFPFSKSHTAPCLPPARGLRFIHSSHRGKPPIGKATKFR